MELCQHLLDKGLNNLYLRPHPRQNLIYQDWYKDHGIKVSDSKVENPFSYLSKIDVLIASESGIHLDACLMGIKSICWILDKTPYYDWYGYYKNVLISYASNYEELTSEILDLSRKTSRYKLLKWYNASYKTEHFGHIGTLIVSFLKHYLDHNIQTFNDINEFVKSLHFCKKLLIIYLVTRCEIISIIISK